MGIKRAALIIAVFAALYCMPAGALEFEQLQPAYEISSYSGSPRFTSVLGFSINFKDDTVALLAGAPLSVNIYGLASGSPLRSFRVFDNIEGVNAFWSCDGTSVIWTASGFLAFGPDGKKLENYEPPEAVKQLKRGRVQCTKQGGLLVMDFASSTVTLSGQKGSTVYPAPCADVKKGCRNSRAEAKIGALGDAAIDTLGGMYVLDLKTGDVIKQYDYKGEFRKGVLGPQSFDSSLMLFNDPVMMTIDDKGMLYVMDSGDHTVKVFDSFGYAKHVFRDNGSWGFSWNAPAGMQAAGAGRLLILDTGTPSLRVFDISRVQ